MLLKDTLISIAGKEMLQAPGVSAFTCEAALTDVFKGLSELSGSRSVIYGQSVTYVGLGGLFADCVS